VSTCGQIIAGEIGKILIRQKAGERIELGDLLVVDDSEGYLLLQITDLIYGSQVPQISRELIAGMSLEGLGGGLKFLEPQLRNYVIASAKAVLSVSSKPHAPKMLPEFFGSVRHVSEKDLQFLSKPMNPMYLGKVRSGSKVLDVDVYVDGVEALTHHVLIPATTGRGKSNLVKVMLWNMIGQGKFGVLVLDPHDEYYGRTGKGLKNHPSAREGLEYYSTTAPPGTSTLVVNLRSIEPDHFEGLVRFSDVQQSALSLYSSEYGEEWIENIMRGTEVKGVQKVTLTVLQRVLRTTLALYFDGNELRCRNNVFSTSAGEATIASIIAALEDGKVVIVDTSRVGDEAELLIGSIIATQVFERHQLYKSTGQLEDKAPVSIVIEEAPRVLGAERLETVGPNIYSTIAREGRKFRVGLIAVTQLTSVIPREILTNMNTKIIFGNEMASERRAIMDSAAQDLSEDDRNIASLDMGEAIVSSIFTRFAVPIRVPLFEELAERETSRSRPAQKTVLIG
jgi:DNA helicase HerA-like ATPase